MSELRGRDRSKIARWTSSQQPAAVVTHGNKSVNGNVPADECIDDVGVAVLVVAAAVVVFFFFFAVDKRG